MNTTACSLITIIFILLHFCTWRLLLDLTIYNCSIVFIYVLICVTICVCSFAFNNVWTFLSRVFAVVSKINVKQNFICLKKNPIWFTYFIIVLLIRKMIRSVSFVIRCTTTNNTNNKCVINTETLILDRKHLRTNTCLCHSLRL